MGRPHVPKGLDPDCGRHARDVVLHAHIIDIGFPKFVEGALDGHLFLTPSKVADVHGPLQGLITD
jgi:hypothetical protein